jgi:hypothetical protein
MTGAVEDVGVFAGEDFVGEIDLARSEFDGQRNIHEHVGNGHQATKKYQPTSSPCLALLSSLQNFFFELPIPFLVLLISPVAQFLDTLEKIADIF